MPRPEWAGMIDFDVPGMTGRLAGWVQKLTGMYEVSIIPRRDTRTLRQLRFYHSCVVRPFAEFLRSQEAALSPKAAHAIAHGVLKDKLLRRAECDKRTGEVIGEWTQSTGDLTVEGMADYIDRSRAWLAEALRIDTPDPGQWADDGVATVTA